MTQTAEPTYPVLDPDAPCAWCGSTERERIQRGPSEKGWQCADADACNAEHRAYLRSIGR